MIIKTIVWRKFLITILCTSVASFLTIAAIQHFFQGGIEDLLVIAGKAFMVGFGLALLFSMPRPENKEYPWM